MNGFQSPISEPRALFPPWLFSVETTTAPMSETLLHASEREFVRNAVAKRKGEFAAGRYCARQALARLNISAPIIPSGRDGCPLWPKGALGSISHTRGCVVSVVGRTSQVAGLGVDVESSAEPFPENILERICRPEELRWLLSMAGETMQLHARALFSVKESIYKCVYSATGQNLNFADASVSLDLRAGLFQARIMRPLGTHQKLSLIGRVGWNPTHVFSGMWMLHKQPHDLIGHGGC